MKIIVKARPNSKVEKVEKIGDNEFMVAVKEPPAKGRANEAIIKLLARHFNVPANSVRIKTGHASKSKLVEILR